MRLACVLLFAFYQVDFARYAEGTTIETLSPKRVRAEALERARQLLSATGTDVSRFVAPAGARWSRVAVRLPP
jgi:hypothetical protein